MGLVLGTLAWLAGTVQYTLTFQHVREANLGDKIPQFFGRPKNHPRRLYIYRAVAMFLLILAFFAWSEIVGIWAVLLVFLGVIPAVVLNVQHNRQAQKPSL